jgi:probable F420-dependent oxidoreductase
LTGTGVWGAGLRYGDPGQAAAAATELESLGYSALWIPDVGGDVFGAVENLLGATSKATVATGILNLWMHSAAETAARHASITSEHGDRFLVGIGISHAPLIDSVKEAGAYRQPLAMTRQFLDDLDAADPPLAPARRVLAALGPKMLELAATRTAGVHPYLVTPEHTKVAREAVGRDAIVAPEQGVVFETDATTARAIARKNLAGYLGLPNYSNNWKRFGFTDDDLADGGSDRLIDALVVWGDEASIASRVQAHRDAGASHVCIQVLTDTPADLALPELRALAGAVL